MATTKITNPDLFDLGSLNTALKLPSGTTAERPTSPSTGEWRYNTTTNLVEFWDGGEWTELQSEDIPPIPSENFNVVLYTGNGSTQSITGVGFQPDFVWIKSRSISGSNHVVYDTTRGAGEYLIPNTDGAEGTIANGLTSFDSDGFTLGSEAGHNFNGATFVAWCWKANGGTTSSNTDGSITSTVQANTKAGFSIVKYTGNQSNATIGHGLGVVPEMIIAKGLYVQNWAVYHKDAGSNYWLQLNGATAKIDEPIWQDTTPTSSVFSVNNNVVINKSSSDSIAYCFHSVAGYSKFGSYTGNGSANGPIVETGFEPAFLMIKNTSSTESGGASWLMYDNKRNTSNPRNSRLWANLSGAEYSTACYDVDFLSNGFQIAAFCSTYGMNESGDTYLYMAFAADPSSTAPTLPDSFANKIYSGNSSNQSITGLGFSPSFSWIKVRNNTYVHGLYDILRGPLQRLRSNGTEANENVPNSLTSFDSDGFTLGSDIGQNQTAMNYVSWNWKANSIPAINTDGTIQSMVSANQAAGFSIVKYTGNGVNASTVGHGLSSEPEVIIIKSTTFASFWAVYNKYNTGSSGNPETEYVRLNSANATATTSVYWGNTAPTSSVFSIGTDTDVNKSGETNIAYCFTSISGFSKMGSYTGDGTTTKTITTGFQPNFVLIKVTDGADNWVILDSARGGSKNLKPNSNAAEATESGTNVEFLSTGFKLIGSGPGLGQVNGNGNDYIYMAYKENPAQYPIPSGEVGYLVVAGGGGGAVTGGAGGAGGLRTTYGTTSGGGSSAESNITLSAQTYTITVGAGGAGLTSGPADGNAGSNSVFGSITSIGGGKGTNSGAGGTGGSGGTGRGSAAGGSGTANQGFNGGLGFGSWTSGGGGGAGQVGQNAPADEQGGDGGNGLNITITGSNAGYAGGGGGAGGTSLGSGGAGGGGNGGKSSVPATSGTTNTGSGGGAQTNGGSTISGAGGSGIVVLRMNTSDYSGTTTGSPTVTTVGTETVLTYTGSGTYVHS